MSITKRRPKAVMDQDIDLARNATRFGINANVCSILMNELDEYGRNSLFNKTYYVNPMRPRSNYLNMEM